MSLNTISPSAIGDGDTISLSSAATINISGSGSNTGGPPEVPRRSNSVVSMPGFGSGDNFKPILSPRYSDSGTYMLSSRSSTLQHQSSKGLDSLNEESSFSSTSLDTVSSVLPATVAPPPIISPRKVSGASDGQIHLQDTSGDVSASSSTGGMSPWSAAASFNPSSPKLFMQYPTSAGDCSSNTSIYNNNNNNSINCDPPHNHNSSLGPIPISPHVNVPHVAQNQFSSHNPPPLPPRFRQTTRIQKTETSHLVQQAPDAPQVSCLLILYLMKFISISQSFMFNFLSCHPVIKVHLLCRLAHTWARVSLEKIFQCTTTWARAKVVSCSHPPVLSCCDVIPLWNVQPKKI